MIWHTFCSTWGIFHFVYSYCFCPEKKNKVVAVKISIEIIVYAVCRFVGKTSLSYKFRKKNQDLCTCMWPLWSVVYKAVFQSTKCYLGGPPTEKGQGGACHSLQGLKKSGLVPVLCLASKCHQYSSSFAVPVRVLNGKKVIILELFLLRDDKNISSHTH